MVWKSHTPSHLFKKHVGAGRGGECGDSARQWQQQRRGPATASVPHRPRLSRPSRLPSLLPPSTLRGKDAALGSHCWVAPHRPPLFSRRPRRSPPQPRCGALGRVWGHRVRGQLPSPGEIVISSCDPGQGLWQGHLSITQGPACPRAAGTGGRDGHAGGLCRTRVPGLGPHFFVAGLAA